MEILRGLGVSKAKIFQGKYEANWKFLRGGWGGGGGLNQKTFCWRGKDFWNNALSTFLEFANTSLPTLACCVKATCKQQPFKIW